MDIRGRVNCSIIAWSNPAVDQDDDDDDDRQSSSVNNHPLRPFRQLEGRKAKEGGGTA